MKQLTLENLKSENFSNHNNDGFEPVLVFTPQGEYYFEMVKEEVAKNVYFWEMLHVNNNIQWWFESTIGSDEDVIRKVQGWVGQDVSEYLFMKKMDLKIKF